ncbi:MAG: hypothetical protein IPJ30_14100 [Acidobacteria bacterium]|nr:hypothetical protein [Acidobacteriota bacterium]
MEVSFCQTLSFDADTFDYEAVSQDNGNATIIKFKIDEKLNSPGDVVVVLSGEDIVFHGMIGKIETAMPSRRTERLAARRDSPIDFGCGICDFGFVRLKT